MKTKINGIDMYYIDESKGTPVLFLHGFPLDHTNWLPVIEKLSGAGRLIAPDLRGFGQSDAPAGIARMSLFADDAAGLLDMLEVEKAVVVGHSMGGYASLAFYRKYPERVCGLGLVASQALPDNAERKAARYDSAKAVASQGSIFAASSLPEKYTADPHLQDMIRKIILQTAPNGIVSALMGLAEREDSTSLLADIQAPVLVVAGAADQLIPVAVSRETAGKIHDVEYVEVEGASHMVMMENPEITAQAIRRLIKRAGK